jgi:4-diphosphocytidyl-2-C-methyl-D-erythritol kinase
MLLSETARAKVNLTLKVIGRRADGYHLIESLVTFASHGDVVTLEPGVPGDLVTTGPFAQAIDGDNLLDKTLRLAREAEPRLRLGRASLAKEIPVAAGLGGGSADAAALLRLIAHANPDLARHIDWTSIAARIGADVPVCLGNVPALMWGIGERLSALPRCAPLPATIPAVLVNPRVPLATAAVFKALGAAPCSEIPPAPSVPRLSVIGDVLGMMRAAGNDLEAPAMRLLPVIGAMQAALRAQPGCVHAALSGSGPTCFGLFESAPEAEAAAQSISREQPGWWTVATALDYPAGR